VFAVYPGGVWAPNYSFYAENNSIKMTEQTNLFTIKMFLVDTCILELRHPSFMGTRPSGFVSLSTLSILSEKTERLSCKDMSTQCY